MSENPSCRFLLFGISQGMAVRVRRWAKHIGSVSKLELDKRWVSFWVPLETTKTTGSLKTTQTHVPRKSLITPSHCPRRFMTSGVVVGKHSTFWFIVV